MEEVKRNPWLLRIYSPALAAGNFIFVKFLPKGWGEPQAPGYSSIGVAFKERFNRAQQISASFGQSKTLDKAPSGVRT